MTVVWPYSHLEQGYLEVNAVRSPEDSVGCGLRFGISSELTGDAAVLV